MRELWSTGHSFLCRRQASFGLMEKEITALRLQEKNRRRVSVYLNGEYAFGLQATIAAPLRVGQILSPEEIGQLRERDSAEVAFDRALNFLSYRSRSRAEIEGYLERHKVVPEIIPLVVDRLTEAGLLDDKDFARYWVENREAFRPRGKRLLRSELRGKGVADAIIDQAIEGIDESEGAYRAARARAPRLSQLDYQTFRRRLSGFLQRRGFDYGTVKESVTRVWQELQTAAEKESL